MSINVAQRGRPWLNEPHGQVDCGSQFKYILWLRSE